MLHLFLFYFSAFDSLQASFFSFCICLHLCSDWVYCYTIQSVIIITSPCSKEYSMSVFVLFYPSTNRCPSSRGIGKHYPSTNRCPSSRGIGKHYPSTNRCRSSQGIGKHPWSLWLWNLCLKFTARLRDLTDNCMCGVQR